MSSKRLRGFTLIEMLVVIGIIALLLALAVPMIMIAYRKAAKTRVAADFQSISVALDAYKADFGDYPRPDSNFTGFATLCKALIGPGPEFGPLPAWPIEPFPAGAILSTGSGQNYKEYVCFAGPDTTGGFTTPNDETDATKWTQFVVSDGKAGPGFKARTGGKAYGPYLDASKFRVQGMAMRDSWDHPILYFPARPGKIAQNTANTNIWPLLTGAPGSVYNIADNASFFLRLNETVTNSGDLQNAMKRMDGAMVRDSIDFDGTIKAGETALYTGPYLLWSAGPDGNFGVSYNLSNSPSQPTKKEIEKLDDITNFER